MQILGRSDEPVRLRDGGRELWRWRYVISLVVVGWALLKVAEFLFVVRKVPTFVEDGYDGQVAEQSTEGTASE